MEQITLYVGQVAGSAARKVFPEFSLVELIRDVSGTTGTPIAAGSVGTIVSICGSGASYLIEFDEPDEVAVVEANGLRLTA